MELTSVARWKNRTRVPQTVRLIPIKPIASDVHQSTRPPLIFFISLSYSLRPKISAHLAFREVKHFKL
jgi:hypothetical protein